MLEKKFATLLLLFATSLFQSTFSTAAERDLAHELATLEVQKDVLLPQFMELVEFMQILSKMGVPQVLGRFPSPDESASIDRMLTVGIPYIVHEGVPQAFWVEKLTKFYRQQLNDPDLEQILRTYQEGHEPQLVDFRRKFVSEVLPMLKEVIKERLTAKTLTITSMKPTIQPGDNFFVNKAAYLATTPKRLDIITFRYPKDETKEFVKRLIGLPGEVIEIREKQVYINGELLHDEKFTMRPDPNVIPRDTQPRDFWGPIKVPENSYFVLGDNRDYSLDSRFWGFVKREAITGHVELIYWSMDPSTKQVIIERIGKRLE
jgi:signal peptidase I